MPESPDITVYVERLAERTVGHRLERVQVLNPFLLRTAVPPIDEALGRPVVTVRRLGKRLAIGLGSRLETGHPGPTPAASATDAPLWLVIHLMRAGRLHWEPATLAAPAVASRGGARTAKARSPGKAALLHLVFGSGQLTLTEAGTRRQASLHLAAGEAGLAAHDAGGLEIACASLADFAARLRAENHTLKRSLTAPALFSGIGNAYSDEILHRARLSPVALSGSLPDADVARLFDAARAVLAEWTTRLREEADRNGGWPAKVTAFRPGMAVHGRYGQACPVCGSPVQRILSAESEANYCARCQTGGKLLADRALSRLLHRSWPKTIDELG
jgi:formamidopyrimidine-DNA glycosylase